MIQHCIPQTDERMSSFPQQGAVHCLSPDLETWTTGVVISAPSAVVAACGVWKSASNISTPTLTLL